MNNPVNAIDPDGRQVVDSIQRIKNSDGSVTYIIEGDAIARAAIATIAIANGVQIISNSDIGHIDDKGNYTTPDGNTVRNHGKKGSGLDYIEGKGHSPESVDDIFGEGSETYSDGHHDNASGKDKTPTQITKGKNGDWAHKNTETNEIIQVNDKNNPKEKVPEPVDD